MNNIDELIKRSDEFDAKWDALPWILEARAQLNSEVIWENSPYSKQQEIVKNCFKEAFWEYANWIKILDKFFFDLEDYINAYRSLTAFTWDKNSEDYESLDNWFISSWNDIIFYIIQWNEIYKQIERDLLKEWKTQEEADEIKNAIYDKFLLLLRENIVYETDDFIEFQIEALNKKHADLEQAKILWENIRNWEN